MAPWMKGFHKDEHHNPFKLCFGSYQEFWFPPLRLPWSHHFGVYSVLRSTYPPSISITWERDGSSSSEYVYTALKEVLCIDNPFYFKLYHEIHSSNKYFKQRMDYFNEVRQVITCGMYFFEISIKANESWHVLFFHYPEMQLEGKKYSSGGRDTRVCGCSCVCGNCRHSMSRSEAINKKQEALNQLSDLLSSVPLTHVILDCSAWTFIDIVGANTLQAVSH